MIIDFHVHTFPGRISAGVIDHLSKKARIKAYTDGSLESLVASMKTSGVDYSVNLPVMTDPSQVEKLNTHFIMKRQHLLDQGVIAFGGIHPDYDQSMIQKEIRRLSAAGICGIKLHPAYQGIDLDDTRTMRILDAASSEGLIILIHAGIDIGIYDHNYSSVRQILKVIDEVHPQKFVLAHFGNWGCWDEVERDLAGADVWFDTAFSIGPIEARPDFSMAPKWSSNLCGDDFVRIARKHGTDRVLFATDSPWGDQSDYIKRIRKTDFTDSELDAVLGGNAKALLGDYL